MLPNKNAGRMRKVVLIFERPRQSLERSEKIVRFDAVVCVSVSFGITFRCVKMKRERGRREELFLQASDAESNNV